MLWQKTAGVLICIIAFLLVLGGCTKKNPESQQEQSGPSETVQQQTDDTLPKEVPYKEEYKADPAAFVVFHQSVEPRETYIPVEDILAYKSEYSECNGTWFRDQLSQEDLCIYNGFLYAMEHCFTGFALYVQDNDKDFHNVRQAVSLDSPFLEQTNNAVGEYISPRPTNYAGESIYVSADQFNPESWQKKMEALKKCRQIVKEIPSSCTTDQQKMEYLYGYVSQNVKYTSYKDAKNNDYLYDAAITGETNCDGYSNLLNLLFNLAGIESYEGMGVDEGQVVGHTWVVAKMNGQFYNFDPTFEATKGEGWETDLVFFGYSDELCPTEKMDCEEQRPKCTDTSRDYHYAHAVISIVNPAEVEKVVQLCRQRVQEGKYVTLVAVGEGLDQDKVSQFATYFISLYGDPGGVKGLKLPIYEINADNGLLWVTLETE